MDTRTRARTILPAAAISLALLASGCSAGGGAQPAASDPSPTRTAPPAQTASPSNAPSADEAFAYPDEDDPTQVAIYRKYEGSNPSGEIIAGPAVLTADRAFTIEAQCEGDGFSFEVMTADGQQRLLVEGDVDCDDPPAGEFTYQLPYSGVVQVNIGDAEGVGRAWVRVVQP
ncbi:MAG: hypothetical protein ABWY37_01230 [Microbacterium pygmaeum]